MAIDLAGVWETFNAFLEGNTFKALLVPILGGLYATGRYFGKRKIERTSEREEIKQLHEIVDLRQKMDNLNLSTSDVKTFRKEVLGKSVKRDVATASYYIERAEYLHEQPQLAHENEDEAITQAEMNAQAYEQLNRAESKLARIVAEKLATCGPEEAAAFQQAQNAWHTWRHAESEWESNVWEGGSIRPLMVATRLESLTRERIAAIHLSGNLEHDPNNVVVPYQKTPRDLPEHLLPGVTEAHVRSVLGPPNFISDNYWQYRFLETRLEIIFEGEVIREAVFAMIDGQRYEASLGVMGDFCFGEVTFGELWKEHNHLELRSRSSARTQEVYTSFYIGLPGASQEYYFGALIPNHGTSLMRTDFEWDFENNAVLGFPEGATINWFGVTNNSDDAPGASWFIPGIR